MALMGDMTTTQVDRVSDGVLERHHCLCTCDRRQHVCVLRVQSSLGWQRVFRLSICMTSVAH